MCAPCLEQDLPEALAPAAAGTRRAWKLHRENSLKRPLYDVHQVTVLLCNEFEAAIAEERVYSRATIAAVDYELREEWKKYLEKMKHDPDVLLGVFRA